MTEHTAPDSPATDSWTLANAKARLSEVIDRAQVGPQIITRHGKPNAVIVSVEEWARKTARKGTLAEFLLASPLRSGDLELERVHDAPHDELPFLGPGALKFTNRSAPATGSSCRTMR